MLIICCRHEFYRVTFVLPEEIGEHPVLSYVDVAHSAVSAEAPTPPTRQLTHNRCLSTKLFIDYHRGASDGSTHCYHYVSETFHRCAIFFRFSKPSSRFNERYEKRPRKIFSHII